MSWDLINMLAAIIIVAILAYDLYNIYYDDK